LRKDSYKVMVRAALLLALTLLFQWSRFLLPVPPVFSTLVTGTLVNACLAIAVELVGLSPTAVISIIAPVVAYTQGMLPLPVFIIPIALANFLYIVVLRTGIHWNRLLAIGTAAIVKSAVLYLVFAWLLTLININPKVAAGVLFIMSWPQLFTAIAGGSIALVVVKRIKYLI